MKKTVLMSAAKKARIALAVMAVFGMSFVGAQEAFAADVTTDLPVKTDAGKNIICGDGAKAEKATSSTVDPANDIVIGVNAIANDKNSIAIGTSANAKAENSVAIGYGSVADAANTISFGSAFDDSKNKRLVNLAAGTSNNDAATYGQVITSVKQNGNKLEFYTGTNTAKAAMDVELYHPVKFEGSNLIGGSGAKVGEGRKIDSFQIVSPNNNVVLGNNAQANGVNNVVMGIGAIANNFRSIVIGESAKGDLESIAMGSFAEDSGAGVAIGFNAKNKGTAAIGRSSKTDGFMAIAIGSDSKAIGEETIALGYKANANNRFAVAIGYGAEATGEASTAIRGMASGSYSAAFWGTASGERSTAVGGTASGYYSNAFGGTASGAYSTAMGYGAKAIGESSMAFGGTANSKGTIALGGTVDGKYSVSIGVGSIAKDWNVVSVGSGDTADGNGIIAPPAYRRIVNMADGKNNTDAATYGQILKKGTYTISLDDTGNGNAVLKTNANNDGPTIKVDASALETQITKNADAIGTLNSLTTTEKTNLVGAVNEVKGTADTALGLANTNKASIGTLTNLTTTEKGNLVGAVNEVKGSVDAANTAIAGKADLGLSNINADGKTVIKNLAKTEAGAIVNVQLGDLSTEKYYVDAGKKVNENISALDKQVKTNADAIDLKANQELSNINATGENKIKTIAGVVVEGKLGTLTSSIYVDAANTVNANISALDVQMKDNADKITTVDNKIGSLSADGKYIKKTKNVSANLVELDNQVNANATALTSKANLDLSNITVAGETKIKDLASIKAGEVVNVKLGAITSTHYVNAGNTVNANISALDKQLDNVENKVGTMTDGNYIDAGNTVAGNLSALDNQLKANTDAINKMADKDLSNISDKGQKVIKDLANEKAGEVVADKLGTITSNNYVSAGNTVNANISKLDEQVKANADAINTKADKDLYNISDKGKNVIKDLANEKAGEVVADKLGTITSNNYVNASNTVNANISALDKQMKVNTDNIGDTSKLNGLGSNLSDAVVTVNNKVGTADELKALKDAGLGDNLAQATAAVNKKADKNAEAIKTVNGRVDELGGRVDTLGGAVSKLDSKVNKVGAGAAALAALHPMEFDSDNKLTFAAGVGSYHGASAAAIGAFYRPSEQVMFSIAGNMGNGENMVNAGVSFALDRPSKTPTTKAALVKTVVAQNEQIAALNETLAEQNEKIARLEAMVEKLAAKQNA